MSERISRSRVESLLPTFCKVMNLPIERTRLDYIACYGGYRLVIMQEEKKYNEAFSMTDTRMSPKEMYMFMHHTMDFKRLQERLEEDKTKNM